MRRRSNSAVSIASLAADDERRAKEAELDAGEAQERLQLASRMEEAEKLKREADKRAEEDEREEQELLKRVEEVRRRKESNVRRARERLEGAKNFHPC